jgi:hypothetical protein
MSKCRNCTDGTWTWPDGELTNCPYCDGTRKVRMNKDLKLLLISLGLLVGFITYIYVSAHYTCTENRYQNLSGAHNETVCTWKANNE